MLDGDFGLDDGGTSSQPPSFLHFFWFCVIGIVLYVVVREMWF